MVVTASQHPPRPGKSPPMLITEAQPSLAAQHAARKKRYVITMLVRALSVILAAVIYASTHLVWLALILAGVGTVLPWIAVVMANDRPPKTKVGPHGRVAPADRTLESRPHRVIDS